MSMKKDTKTIKVYIEVPEKWFDGDMSNDLDFITRTCRREIQSRLMDIAIDKLLIKHYKMAKKLAIKQEMRIRGREIIERIEERRRNEKINKG